MLKNILCIFVLTNIILEYKGSSVATDEVSIRYNGASENTNLELLNRLKTLENLRRNDAEESIRMKKTMDSYQSVLGKALNDLTTLKEEFRNLKQENNRLHSKLETVMLQNVALTERCTKRCNSAEKPNHLSQPTTTLSQENTSYNRNFTDVYTSGPAKPHMVTQETANANSTVPMHSKREVIIRRSPVPFPRTRRVAEGVHGSGFFARSSNTVNSVAVGHTILFDSVVTNTHNDYNRNTGAFTCSTPGLYVFTWTIKINIHYLKSQLLKNGAAVAYGYTGDDSTYNTAGTSTAVLQLAQGDIVVVHVTERPGAINVLPYVTSFSGFLV